MKKTKWLIYTVIIGLIPFIIRTLIFAFDRTCSFEYWLNESDFIIFGLVLNLSNINELEDKSFEDKNWKTINVGASVVFIVIFSAILSLITYADFKLNTDIDKTRVKVLVGIFSMITLIFSYSIYNRLSKVER